MNNALINSYRYLISSSFNVFNSSNNSCFMQLALLSTGAGKNKWNKCSENIIKITKLKINGKLGKFLEDITP